MRKEFQDLIDLHFEEGEEVKEYYNDNINNPIKEYKGVSLARLHQTHEKYTNEFGTFTRDLTVYFGGVKDESYKTYYTLADIENKRSSSGQLNQTKDGPIAPVVLQYDKIDQFFAYHEEDKKYLPEELNKLEKGKGYDIKGAYNKLLNLGKLHYTIEVFTKILNESTKYKIDFKNKLIIRL